MENSLNNLIFSGYFERSLDEKFRLSIPARLRTQLEKAQDKDEVIYIFYSTVYKVIRIYTHDSWISFIQPKLDAIEDPDERLQMTRAVYRFTETQKTDSQGRIAVNKKLASLIGIEKNVSICGMGRGIEIAAADDVQDSYEVTEKEESFLKGLMI